VLTTEIFSHADNLIRNATAVELERFFMLSRVLKMRAFKRTRNIHFALIAAAKRTDIALYSWAMALRTPGMTDSAQFRH
jgi:hypothetical protein